MTTIAATNKEISCDLQFTHGSGKFKGSTKIMEVSEKMSQAIFGVPKAFVGVSGETNKMGLIWSWLKTGDKVPDIGDKTAALALTENGLYISNNLHNWDKVDQDYYAIGSGCDFAIAALALGRTTQEAVDLASKQDIYTGMGIKTYEL